MTGSIPSSIMNLSNLTSLYLGDNKFFGVIPDLSGLPLTTLWLSYNQFEFGDFENQFSNYQNISSFAYTPQDYFYEELTSEFSLGNDIILTTNVSGTTNNYQWYKVNTPTWSDDINNATAITGATSTTLTISNAQATDFGYYYCVVTNTTITSLEIKKEKIRVVQAVPQSEKDALVALYNATDGPNWNNNTNWNTAEPVATWDRVDIEDGHIVRLPLNYNNLTGYLPNDLQNLVSLKYLGIFGNNISGTIPDLTSIATLNQFSISNNNFHFADFENEFTSYLAYNDTPDGYFNHVPMKKTDDEIIYDLVVGDDYTLTMSTVNGTGVTYQWYKNDELIVGETSLTYTITNAQETDAANYTCKASSPIVTDLIIERETIHIYGTMSAEDKNALIMLYYATDGTNWTNNTNWNTTAPVYEWFGVEIEGNRVIEINLANNNLVGVLPTQIGDLDTLKVLHLNSNQISGSIPNEVGNLTDLRNINFDFNQFSGNIPVELGSLTNLTDLSFWDNQLSGTIPVELGNLTNLEIFSLEYNQLTGTIPAEFANLTAMRSFWLNNNQLTGDVPDIFSSMPALYYCSISDNQLTGAVDFPNNPDLNGLWLYNNQLTSINTNSNTQLGNLYCQNNLITELDLTQNTQLRHFTCNDNPQLSSLDLRNANNTNISYFKAQNNPFLTCIFVDDIAWSENNWTNVDPTTHFVETQTECDAAYYTYVPDDNFEQALIEFGYDDVLDNYVLTANISGEIATLDVANRNISDLTGIEDFIRLIKDRCNMPHYF